MAKKPCFEAYIVRCTKCHGMIAAVMDDPDHKEDTAKEVAGYIEAGFEVSRVKNEDVRVMEWCKCKPRKDK